MSVSVAEYLGQRTDIAAPAISPVQAGSRPMCPFMNDLCSKVAEGYQPVCSVRKSDDSVWMVCRHRLCATKKNIALSNYQIGILMQVSKTIYSPIITPADVYIKREEPMRVTSHSNYHADFIMMANGRTAPPNGPNRVVLEMQGGGETSQTGALTQHVLSWRNNQRRSNHILSAPVSGVGTIETNAWRRQQEQFLVKGSIVTQTGGAIVLCVGTPLYDHLRNKLQHANLPNLQQANWSLALIAFCEDRTSPAVAGPIPLCVDSSRLLFTNYIYFTTALITQGRPLPGIFQGQFDILAGGRIVIP